MPGFQYGKREPKRAASLKFAHYDQTAALANFPPVDYLGLVDWAPTMNGNDAAGDCVACLWANSRSLVSRALSGTTEYPTQAQVWTVYKTQNPGFVPGNGPHGYGSNDDQGMDEQTLWEYLVKNGGPDGKKLIGFAQIDHTNLQEIKNAISLGGTVAFGVQVAAAQQSQFPGVWDYVPGSPIEGGHAILAGGHTDVASNDVKAACWASEFGTSDVFLQHQLDEAWLLLWEEDLGSRRFMAGMDLASFASDYEVLTGRQFPVAVNPAPDPTPAPQPAPAPGPSPLPVPGPTDLDAALWAHVKAFALGRHYLKIHDAAQYLVEWAINRGLYTPGEDHEPEHAA